MSKIKKGSIVYRPGFGGLIKHYGVYIGNNKVIHYDKNTYKSSSYGIIWEVELEEFLDGEECSVESEPENQTHAAKIIERAQSQIKRINYDVWGEEGENCEHFANWCLNPRLPSSIQATSFVKRYSYNCSVCNNPDGMAECPECVGEGKVDCSCNDGNVDCPECKGTSYVPCDVYVCTGGKIDCEESGCHEGKIECEECNGTGRMECGECDGDGEVEKTCGYCYGGGCGHCDDSGTRCVKCPECRGKGEVKCDECEGKAVVKCPECDDDGKIDCPECDLDGEIPCSECDGSGEIKHDECDEEGKIDCEKCDGSGEVTCAHCCGEGIEPDPTLKK